MIPLKLSSAKDIDPQICQRSIPCITRISLRVHQSKIFSDITFPRFHLWCRGAEKSFFRWRLSMRVFGFHIFPVFPLMAEAGITRKGLQDEWLSGWHTPKKDGKITGKKWRNGWWKWSRWLRTTKHNEWLKWKWEKGENYEKMTRRCWRWSFECCFPTCNLTKFPVKCLSPIKVKLRILFPLTGWLTT